MMLELEDAQFAEAGDNRYTLADPSRDIVTARGQGDGGNSAAYLAARLKKAGRDDLLEQVGQIQQSPRPWPGAELRGPGGLQAACLPWRMYAPA
jgi:hypothetical protein